MLLFDGENRKLLVWIPARGGSKGLPRKALLDLGGKSVIAHTIEAAMAINGVDRVLVNTDDEEIRDVAQQIGAEVPFLRPAELARDDSSLDKVLEHQWHWLHDKEEYVPDIQIGMSPTYPFRRKGMIDKAIKIAADRPDVVTVTSVVEIIGGADNYWIQKNNRMRRFKLSNDSSRPERRRLFQSTFSFNVIVDCRNYLFLSESRRGPVPFALSPIEAIDLDDPKDLELARLVLEIGLFSHEETR